MFQKILVAEDMSSINEGVRSVLKEAGVRTVHHSQYCDEAFLKLKRAKLDGQPYELLICDMSFKKDHREDAIKNGEDLIKQAKIHQPNLKVVAYSIEDKVAKVKRLFKSYNIEGYVCKDRNGLNELFFAVKAAYKDKRFASPTVASAVNDDDVTNDFGDYDVCLLSLLSDGYKQIELSKQLDLKGLSPSSKSAVEKRINSLKIMFGAKNTVHLIAITKDLGLI